MVEKLLDSFKADILNLCLIGIVTIIFLFSYLQNLHKIIIFFDNQRNFSKIVSDNFNLLYFKIYKTYFQILHS